jgi:hypothetical protein
MYDPNGTKVELDFDAAKAEGIEPEITTEKLGRGNKDRTHHARHRMSIALAAHSIATAGSALGLVAAFALRVIRGPEDNPYRISTDYLPPRRDLVSRGAPGRGLDF